MVPVIAWLWEALEGAGPFAPEVQVHARREGVGTDVRAAGVENLQEAENRVAGYLGSEAESRQVLKEDVLEFYAE